MVTIEEIATAMAHRIVRNETAIAMAFPISRIAVRTTPAAISGASPRTVEKPVMKSTLGCCAGGPQKEGTGESGDGTVITGKVKSAILNEPSFQLQGSEHLPRLPRHLPKRAFASLMQLLFASPAKARHFSFATA
jgi:hypothetical protein